MELAHGCALFGVSSNSPPAAWLDQRSTKLNLIKANPINRSKKKGHLGSPLNTSIMLGGLEIAYVSVALDAAA